MAGTTLAPPLRMPRAISQALMPTGIPATSRAVTLATQAQAGTRAMTTPIRVTVLATRAVTQATQAQATVAQATKAMVQVAVQERFIHNLVLNLFASVSH